MSRRNSARAAVHAVILLLLLPFSLLPAYAQDPYNSMGSTTNTMTSFDKRSSGTTVHVSVFSEDGKTPLDRQSIVKATNQRDQTVSWQTTDDRSEAFLTLPFGKYGFEVSAFGYLTEQKSLQVVGDFNTIPVEIRMRRDPAAVDLSVAEAAMPSKARKEVKHAVSALKSGKLKDAKKRLDAAYTLSPSNPDLNFLLGYLSYLQQDLVQAHNYLSTAASLNPRNAQALTLLGRVVLIQGDYPAAASTLEKAVDADSSSWIAHNLLADAYLRQGKYEGALQQAELALARGKADASAAQLTLGQALVNLGKKEEGIQALKSFVQDSPKNPTVPQVQTLIAEIEGRSASPPSQAETAPTRAGFTGVDPLLASPEPSVSVKPWQPLGIDEVHPAVAAGVACPFASVMEISGQRVQELVGDVSRIAAIEHLLHQRVDEMGNPATRETRDFNYVAAISEAKPGYLAVDEYRAEHLGLADFPDQIASSGFATLALVFHPTMRENFDMVCEGLGDWHGQAAWLVHFKQREDRPARFHDYKVGSQVYSLRLKGRAWITADKYQIVRIESDLVKPIPEIQLRSEHQVVEYGPVPFQKKNIELWLPKSAEFYLDFRKHRYFRRHTFDHFMLFAVDSEERRSEPKVPAADRVVTPLPN